MAMATNAIYSMTSELNQPLLTENSPSTRPAITLKGVLSIFGVLTAASFKVWGGDRLGREWHYEIPDSNTGECWGVSAHPNGDCTVREGRYAGGQLAEIKGYERIDIAFIRQCLVADDRQQKEQDRPDIAVEAKQCRQDDADFSASDEQSRMGAAVL